MRIRLRVLLLSLSAMVITVVILRSARFDAQQPSGRAGQPAAPTPTLGLDHGTLEFDTPDFTLKLVKDSQTVAAMQPKGANGVDADTPFDFTPADQLTARQGDRFNHLGDITLRVKQGLARRRVDRPGVERCAQAGRGHKSVAPAGRREAAGGGGSDADVARRRHPCRSTRSWQLDRVRSSGAALRSDEQTAAPVTIGGLGFPVVFNNMIQNFVTNRARTLPQAHEICSFFDPYVGRDGGLPAGDAPLRRRPRAHRRARAGTRTPFEAFRPLNDASRRGQTFEGAFEWTVASQAYAENEWKNVKQWNAPTSIVLKPGETRAYGLRFLVADEIRHIERTLAANDRPVAVGIPGYIVPMDIEAKLFLTPGNRGVRNIEIEPAGALTVTQATAGNAGRKSGVTYVVQGKHWGRARLVVNYSDGRAEHS